MKNQEFMRSNVVPEIVVTRFKEHISHTNNNHTRLPSAAIHMKNKLSGRPRICEHKFNINNLKLLNNIIDKSKLDVYEATSNHHSSNFQIIIKATIDFSL
jgi:hypothetical protein